jgi:hypothetical protein
MQLNDFVSIRQGFRFGADPQRSGENERTIIPASFASKRLASIRAETVRRSSWYRTSSGQEGKPSIPHRYSSRSILPSEALTLQSVLSV